MTYVETSAVVAVLLEEPGSAAVLAQIHAAPLTVTSVVSKVEMAVSIGRAIKNYTRGAELVDDFLVRAGVKVLPVTTDIYGDVVRAYARYGKGSGHPAKLNFGDCFSYAVAKRESAQLLFVGNDFSRTDLAPG